MKTAKPLTFITIFSFIIISAFAQEGSHKNEKADHHHEGSHKKHEGSHQKHGSMIQVKGEILDLACYIDHNAKGASHESCAKTCIKSGLPVGIKSEKDGKVYLIVGDHKAINKELAEYAAKTIEIKGKFVTRDGINLLENAMIVE